VDGNCLDMANVPPHQDFKHKVHAKAYKATERNGLVWVFMGDQDKVPALPMLESHLLPESETTITFAMRECNFLQALEGDIDTSHFSFLHVGSVKLEDLAENDLGRYQLLNRRPEFVSDETPWGTMYAAFRPADGDQLYWRIAHFLFPCFTMQPNGNFSYQVASRAWVPLDDTHTMFIQVNWKGLQRGMGTTKTGEPIPGGVGVFEYLPNTTDWLGRWRITQNMGNDYQIDREAQRRNEIYTGITRIHTQDQAVTESMGGIVDHTFEHLAPSDLMITQTRRRLLRAVQALAEHGTLPPGIEEPSIYLGARGGQFVTDAKTDWRSAYAEQVRLSVNPTGRLLQAAE
jgi:phthalate 4,5-dioxygenase